MQEEELSVDHTSHGPETLESMEARHRKELKVEPRAL
jgi:hypothetical protein